MKPRDLIPWNRGKRDVQSQRQSGILDPERALSDMTRAMEDLWRTFDMPMRGRGGDLEIDVPRIDVRENDREIDIDAELPGMSEKDVEVSVADGALVIRGEKSEEHDEEREGYVVHERSFGHVERVVPLPDGVDVDHAKATFKNGLLSIAIPKTAEAQSSSKRIQVQQQR
jgi:HSP20 family protein